MWSWMAEEIEERQRLKKEKEEAKKKEEDEKIKKEAEVKQPAEAKDKDDFKASIGRMVQEQMCTVCEEVLGRKVRQDERPFVAVTTEIRRRADADSQKAVEDEVLRKKDLEIGRLKQMVAETQRQVCQPQSGQHEQELNSLRMDNQHLIKDVISLKEQVGELLKLTKPVAGVANATPTVAKEKGKAIYTPTAGDYVKLSEAYRRMRDEKDLAEREVHALKERINRIGAATSTPTSIKRKRVMRKSVSPPSNLRIRLSKASSPAKHKGSGEKGCTGVKFIKLKDETREDFNKRVCVELSKLKKKEIETLCKEEHLEYVTIKTSAADIADAYTDRAFGKLADNTETHEDSKMSEDVASSSGRDGDEEETTSGC
ncbi:hypothetical protein CBR_g49962 [Chara braunii]|uniref:Uncharacterized protein n=1 Tax=Chara braunii TaxID=69332 RepID=A0A388K577_CHABU|nr:hypothetical protein CBR_g49962 [Chara braunii]|eukprot:GBG65166.1 hypothetical protein CBR_g49962 [Chara braunii]